MVLEIREMHICIRYYQSFRVVEFSQCECNQSHSYAAAATAKSRADASGESFKLPRIAFNERHFDCECRQWQCATSAKSHNLGMNVAIRYSFLLLVRAVKWNRVHRMCTRVSTSAMDNLMSGGGSSFPRIIRIACGGNDGDAPEENWAKKYHNYKRGKQWETDCVRQMGVLARCFWSE